MKNIGMKFSLWTDNGALNSKPIFSAFADSLRLHGHTVVYNTLGCDIDVIWSVLWYGRMAGNKDIWDRAQRENRKVIVLEVGGIKRGHTWKVGINGINREACFGSQGNGPERAELLGLKCKTWKHNNDNGSIVIACQHAQSHQWRNQHTVPSWAFGCIEEIRQHTNREIIVRPHPRCPITGIEFEFPNVKVQEPVKVPNTYDDFDFDLTDVYAVVNWSSNPATQAVLEGIPVFVGPDSLAWDVGNHQLTYIDNPRMPDRTQWVNDLAYTEWTIDEISQGLPIKHLTNFL